MRKEEDVGEHYNYHQYNIIMHICMFIISFVRPLRLLFVLKPTKRA